MNAEQFTLFIGHSHWRLGIAGDEPATVETIGEASPDALEQTLHALRDRLSELDYAGQPILLALPSRGCLAATIATDDLERSGRRRAMAFRLEEHLPVSAESMIADFVEHSDEQALGLCLEADKLAELIQRLQAAGITVGPVCPRTWLTTADLLERHADADAAMIYSEDGYDLITLRSGRPRRWWWLPEDESAVAATVAELQRDGIGSLVVVGCSSPEQVVPREIRVLPDDADAFVAAARYAAHVLVGDATPWVNFRRDALAAPQAGRTYRKPLSALAAAAVLLLVAIIGITQWRAQAYDQLAQRYYTQQARAFSEALPAQQRVPQGGMLRRLKSEHRKLVDLGGVAGDSPDTPGVRPISALAQLQLILSALPAEARYRVLDLSIRPDMVRLDGEARGHVQAEQIAGALRQTGFYSVEPPRTQALRDGGVNFLFTATPQFNDSLTADGGTP